MHMHREEGYSAKVEIRLEVEGVVLEVAQVGRDSLVLRDSHESGPTGDARVVITVDGREHIHPVFLHQGIRKDSLQVNFS
jgi:hypothetical protein